MSTDLFHSKVMWSQRHQRGTIKTLTGESSSTLMQERRCSPSNASTSSSSSHSIEICTSKAEQTTSVRQRVRRLGSGKYWPSCDGEEMTSVFVDIPAAEESLELSDDSVSDDRSATDELMMPSSFEDSMHDMLLKKQRIIALENIPRCLSSIRQPSLTSREHPPRAPLSRRSTGSGSIAGTETSMSSSLLYATFKSTSTRQSSTLFTSSDSSNNNPCPHVTFTTLRITYLLVTLVVKLADGLQGTHLYVLYDGYGYSVASLYCLGFITGGIMSPITGPLVDRIGRKRSAILYCLLETFINQLEQYPILIGLIISRMIGGFTTNLLNSVFETWLDTEYRRRDLQKEKYEIIMRDSVIVSNLAAIASGYLAHVLAERWGAIGPFRGAVACTTIALFVISAVWSENYGTTASKGNGAVEKHSTNATKEEDEKGMLVYLSEAIAAFKADSKMLRIGTIQGLSEGSMHIFIFLWSPALAQLAKSAVKSATWGLDSQGKPAYGLIFGAFMAAGVLGGLLAPMLRLSVSQMLSPVDKKHVNDENSAESDDAVEDDLSIETVEVDGEEIHVRPMAVEFLAATCYMLSAMLLIVPCMFANDDGNAFAVCLVAFLVYELLIGIFLPCEGVIRSLYFPANGRASVMALPRIIVNGAVSVGVASTNFVSLKTAFAAVASLMVISTVLQLSLISSREWSILFSRLCICCQTILNYVPCLPKSYIRSIFTAILHNPVPCMVNRRSEAKKCFKTE